MLGDDDYGWQFCSITAISVYEDDEILINYFNGGWKIKAKKTQSNKLSQKIKSAGTPCLAHKETEFISKEDRDTKYFIFIFMKK